MGKAAKTTTVLSSKGQLILPAAIRKRRRWDTGTRLVIEETTDGVLLKAAPLFPPTKVEQVFGSIAYKGPPKTLADMDDAITAEVKDRHARGRY